MKLVKIDDAWINPDAIDEIKKDGNDGNQTFIGLRSNNPINVNWPIEKVLQAIEGSQEHSIKSNDGKDIYLREYVGTVKGIDAKDIKSGDIGISFNSDGTAIINAKKIKLNGVDLQNQEQSDERYLELASHISDLQGQIAGLQDVIDQLLD